MDRTISDDTPLGLAAAARALGDPSIKVSTLAAAISEGRLTAIDDALIPGKKLVTLAAIKAMQAADAFQAAEDAGQPDPQPADAAPAPACRRRLSKS